MYVLQHKDWYLSQGFMWSSFYRRAYVVHTSTDCHSGIQKGGEHRSVICSQVARELMQLSTKSSFRAKWMCTLAPVRVGCWFVLTARLLPDWDQPAALPSTSYTWLSCVRLKELMRLWCFMAVSREKQFLLLQGSFCPYVTVGPEFSDSPTAQSTDLPQFQLFLLVLHL